jgi:hypothetical protein
MLLRTKDNEEAGTVQVTVHTRTLERSFICIQFCGDGTMGLNKYKTVPKLIANMSDFEASICNAAPEAYGSGASGLWVFCH